LNEINLEKEEQKKRLIEKELENKRLKRQQLQHNKSNLTKNNNQNNIKYSKIATKPKLDIQRPAFLTEPFTSYPENNYKKFQNSSKSNENIAVITILPHDSYSNIKQIKQLNKQELPSLSINPLSNKEQHKPSVNEKNQNISINNDEKNNTTNYNDKPVDDENELELNQKGIGIDIAGKYKKSIDSPKINESADLYSIQNTLQKNTLDMYDKILKYSLM
jgi:hypothetical protein